MGSPLVVLIAAHNEADAIEATLRALTAQTRRPDRIVVAADNCTDDTVAVARSVKGVTVFETKKNSDRKPGALNQAWRRFGQRAEIIVCVDADTILDPTAVGDWEAEFHADPYLGGCSAKFTMLVSDHMTHAERLLVRLQRAEFSKWTDLSLRRGRRTSVLAGTACALNNDALKEVMERTERHAPWLTSTMVEDFELTYRLRELGWHTKVSASVRAYTDAMTNLRSLWAQRMKWQTGTVEDLLVFGYNQRTKFDWWQQAQGVTAIAVRVLWVGLLVMAAVMGRFQWQPLWLLAPLLFLANDVKQAMRIPRRDWADVLVAASFVPQELFAYLRAGWFTWSWTKVLARKLFGITYRDGWANQEHAEASRRRRLVPNL